MQQQGSFAKALAFPKQFLHLLADAIALAIRLNQGSHGRGMSLTQVAEDPGNGFVTAGLGVDGSLDEFVGDTTHRGNDDYEITLSRSGLNDLDHPLYAGSVAHRGPAKFQDSQRPIRVHADDFAVAGAVGKKRRGKRRGPCRFRMQNPVVARGRRVMLDLGIYFASQSAFTLGFSGPAPSGKESDGTVEFCLPYQFRWVRLLRIASLTRAGSCQGTS